MDIRCLTIVGAGAVVVTLSAVSLTAAKEQQPSPVERKLAMPSDYPPMDDRIWALERTGLTRKLAREALAASPDAPETFELLLRAHRVDEAIDVLGSIADRRPREIDGAFDVALRSSHEINGDAARPRDDALRNVAARTAVSLQRLPREAAAPVARALLMFENQFLSKTAAERNQRLSEFVARWQGTEAALLTEVDVMTAGRLDLQRLDRLEAFARAHPRTIAAAKALYLQAFDLTHNAMALRIERAGDDPLQRFLKVRDIVNELETAALFPSVCSSTARFARAPCST